MVRVFLPVGTFFCWLKLLVLIGFFEKSSAETQG